VGVRAYINNAINSSKKRRIAKLEIKYYNSLIKPEFLPLKVQL
jgi:hypothetical protein